MGRSLQGQDATTPGDDPLQHEVPEHTVQISAFELDEFEVTVGRFRRFVDAYEREGIPAPGAGSHRNIVDSGFPASGVAALPSTRAALVQRLHPQSTWTQTEASTETLPITGLDWYVAFAFCIWDGGRLPTESEWERAAAGGEDNRLYPWGSSYPDPRAADRAVYSSDRPQAVGMMLKGVGRYGHRDLAGNAAEWVLDTYDAKRYASVPPNCADCANLAWTLPTTHAARVMRGGHYNSVSSEIRAASRASLGANGAMIGVGMRCAR